MSGTTTNDYIVPQWFTLDDVQTLEDAIYAIHGPKMDGLRPGIEQKLDNLRERIEAFLSSE